MRYNASGYDFLKIHNERSSAAEAVLAAARRVGIPEAGAGLLLGSDFPLGGSARYELILLVEEAGLTPYEALATGTKNFAAYVKSFDLDGDITGTIEVGKRADLVLLNGNPLRDITKVNEVAGVMTGGRWLSGMSRDCLSCFQGSGSAQRFW